ncbi:MFS transporter [Halarcobacter anaerophilus]|uniref:MFS transporter n=1 Tax=Halarcobacter anaerophilus TaxID=877500 RepID=UPI0005CB0CA1|nr:MFS transporter [Halarcobacter anaerophilus]
MQNSILKISLILFFVVSVIFSTIYTPQAILPTLKQTFNISIIETNLLISGMLFILMITTPFYASISNRFEKKNIMVFSTFFLFISVLFSAMTTNFYLLLICRIIQGIFIPGITAIMLSYVQEIYPKSNVGLGMGIYMAATSFGAVIGRLLAGWITFIYSWRIAFAFFAFLLIIAFFSIIFGLPSPKKIKTKKLVKKGNLLNYLCNKQILSVLLIPAIVFFSFMAISTFATYHLAEAPFNFNAKELGNIFLVLFSGVLISPLAGKYSDIIGRVKILFFGIGILIIGISLTLSSSYILIIIGITFVTIGMFTVQSVSPTYLGELVPNNKGTVTVLYQTFFYLGGFLGTLIPAITWKYYGYNGVAIFCIILILLGITPLTFQLIITKKKKENVM